LLLLLLLLQDFDNGCGGGAMWVLGSQVTHNDRATYQSNTARELL
jgi:hypothetical protein